MKSTSNATGSCGCVVKDISDLEVHAIKMQSQDGSYSWVRWSTICKSCAALYEKKGLLVDNT